MANDYSDLAVCTKHFTLTGTYQDREHRCRCQPTDEAWRQREWGGYDLAALVDLCHLCVRAPVRSGSRWTWYACDSCRTVDNRVANAILGKADRRNRVLPLGRHSMMNGVSLRVEHAQDDAVKSRFIESVMELNGLWSRIFAWRSEEAQRLVNAPGFRGVGSVPLNQWLKASRASLGASVDAWCRFVGEDLPDLTELADLQQVRQDHVDGKTQ